MQQSLSHTILYYRYKKYEDVFIWQTNKAESSKQGLSLTPWRVPNDMTTQMKYWAILINEPNFN